MRGRLFIMDALALAGFTAMLLIAVPSVLAVDQLVGKMIRSQIEPGKDLTRPVTLDRHGKLVTAEPGRRWRGR